jgi:hypothetical protein
VGSQPNDYLGLVSPTFPCSVDNSLMTMKAFDMVCSKYVKLTLFSF